MKVGWIFKKYMKPFLEKHGFREKYRDSLYWVYTYSENENILIASDVGPVRRTFVTDVSNGSGNPVHLTEFYDGPEDVGQKLYSPDGGWFYDTEEEFLGVLERQSELLEEWVFDWMFGRIEVDIRDILDKKASERYEETKILIAQYGREEFVKHMKIPKEIGEWQKTRFYPKKWEFKRNN